MTELNEKALERAAVAHAQELRIGGVTGKQALATAIKTYLAETHRQGYEWRKVGRNRGPIASMTSEQWRAVEAYDGDIAIGTDEDAIDRAAQKHEAALRRLADK